MFRKIITVYSEKREINKHTVNQTQEFLMLRQKVVNKSYYYYYYYYKIKLTKMSEGNVKVM